MGTWKVYVVDNSYSIRVWDCPKVQGMLSLIALVDSIVGLEHLQRFNIKTSIIVTYCRILGKQAVPLSSPSKFQLTRTCSYHVFSKKYNCECFETPIKLFTYRERLHNHLSPTVSASGNTYCFIPQI